MAELSINGILLKVAVRILSSDFQRRVALDMFYFTIVNPLAAGRKS